MSERSSHAHKSSMGLDQGELDTVIGVGLDTVATFTGAVGKMLLRHAAVTGNMWFYPLGFLFTGVIDPAFDASAYSFAAASIVTACAGLVIVWTVILAPCYLGEPLTQSRAGSALLICAGTIGTGVFGNHVEVERTVDEYLALFTRPAACAYYAVLAVCLAACLARKAPPAAARASSTLRPQLAPRGCTAAASGRKRRATCQASRAPRSTCSRWRGPCLPLPCPSARAGEVRPSLGRGAQTAAGRSMAPSR